MKGHRLRTPQIHPGAGLFAREMTLEELFSGSALFRLPEFQRDYSWTTQEARQLISDVAAVASYGDATTPPPPYFLGAIVLLDKGSELDPGTGSVSPPTTEIVDGQQRIITLLILIACLRDLDTGQRQETLHGLLVLADDPGTYRICLRLAGHQTVLEQRVLLPGATRRRGPALSGDPGADNLILNRNLFMRQLREMTADERGALADYLVAGCRLLVMRTADIDYAYQIFLTINDRGMSLTPEDILRGELLGPLNREQQARYDGVLAEFNRYRFETRSDRPKKGKTFFSHLAAIHGAKGKSIVAEIRRMVQQMGGPAHFGAKVFEPLAQAYLTVKRPPTERRPRSPELEHYLTVFRWHETFGDDDWVPLAMIWLSRFGSDEAATIAFFKAMDRFALALRAIGSGYPVREKRYGAIRETLLKAEVTPEPTELFALSGSEQRLAINCIAKRCWKTDAQLCRMVLTRLDAQISGRPLADYEATIATQAFTVEHVLPQANRPPKEWLVLFPDPRRRALLTQCLGNLVLVPPAVNDKAGVLPFEDKRRLYLAGGEPPFALTAMLAEPAYATWSDAAVTARQNLLVAAVQKIWSFEADLSRLVL